MSEGAPTGPLDGYRVIELGTLIAGPFAGKLLGDMGADVIKIESPDRPDPPTRHSTPFRVGVWPTRGPASPMDGPISRRLAASGGRRRCGESG